ncbi:luciferin 4-monooxygenase-like [Pseudomyrmex gracilis]|uniref:luciferin 4-monooxygenase-like n=1 Tax=Pseudomyrmex gracilis TaxID=219809 RepID=UPI000995DC99|nr:luciferin 4-monooxygenase-like [Pseudomyrmex gracilis]XP_020288011.1 luciferin 4-monooxygenase-like [Pseudomyrmex gracilis]
MNTNMIFPVKKICDVKENSSYILKPQHVLPLSNEHVGELILNELRSAPNFIGQIHAVTGQATTFQEMRERSVKCALWLRKVGISSNKKMVICTNNIMEAYVPFLAGLYNNIIVNIWDVKYCNDNIRLLYFLTQTCPDIIFIDDINVTVLLSAILILQKHNVKLNIQNIVVIGKCDLEEKVDIFESIINNDFDANELDKFACVELKSTMDIAVQMFSSNAISYPGNAQIPYAAFISPSNNNTPTMCRDEVGLWFGSLCWTHSLLLTVRCILSHVTAIKYLLFSEAIMYRIIEKYKVNWVFLESNMCYKFSRLLRTAVNRYNLSSLRQLLFGDVQILNFIQKYITNTLNNVVITQVYCTSEAGVIAYQRSNDAIGSCGYVSNNVKVMIIHEETRKLVGSNVKGEIWCKTPCIAPSSVTGCKSDVSNGWFYTGDFGYYDKDKNMVVLEKVNKVIKYEKHYLYPSRIENIIKCRFRDAVSDVAIISHPCDHHCLLAYIKKSPNSEVTPKQLIDLILNIETKCPAIKIYFLKYDMSYLPNGQIDRARLCKLPVEY